jgi:hypothetical protein
MTDVKFTKKKATSFWPLVITILNLPPNCRIKLGVGMFLVSIFTAQQGSQAEDFLFKDCYIKELSKLYDGYLYTNPKTNQKYLIQVRLIVHCYDTKAVEDHLHVQSSGSLAGCFMCNSGRGVKIIDTDTVVFIGNRISLSNKNYLRSIGQSEECCPKNYYTDFNRQFEESTLSNKASRKNEGKPYTMAWDSKKPIKCCSLEEYNFLSNFFVSRNKDFEFEHLKYFHPEDFENDLWFHHADFRTQTKHKRKTNQEYKEAYEMKIKLNEKEYNGVKGYWHEHVLPNVNIETDLMWDPFHVLSNIASNILQNWKSERFSEKITKYNKKINIFPGLNYIEGNKVGKKVLDTGSKAKYWFIDKSYFNELDAIINSLVIPSGFSDEFQCRNVFERSGFLNGSAKIQLLTVLMPLIMYHCKLKNIIKISYVKFFLCVCFDINSLMSPVFENQNIKELYKKVLELLCLHEGMFPITENKIIWHQLIDLPLHIPKCGTIKNWWAISGERSLHSIKQHLPKGGLNNEHTVMSRYTAVEDERFKEAYRTPSKNLTKLQITLYDDRYIKNINGIISYSNTTFKLYNVVNYSDLKKMLKNDDIIHNEFEVDELLKVIIVEIMKKTISKNDALEKSPTFRVYNDYNIYKTSKNKSECIFYDFVKEKIIAEHNDFVTINANNKDCVSERAIASDNDFGIVKKLICYLHKPDQIYKKAIIYGVKMHGRGFEYKEDEFNEGFVPKYGASTVFKSKNILNSIKNCWHHGKSLSSWFSFRNYLCTNKIEIDSKVNDKIIYLTSTMFLKKFLELNMDN